MPEQGSLYSPQYTHALPFPPHPTQTACLSLSSEQTLNPGAEAQFTWNAAHIKLLQVWLLVNPCCYSPLDVVLEATAFSLTSVRLEHFTMGFSTFFFSLVVELWDWASMMTSHYFSNLRTNTWEKQKRKTLKGKKKTDHTHTKHIATLLSLPPPPLPKKRASCILVLEFTGHVIKCTKSTLLPLYLHPVSKEFRLAISVT